MRSVFSDFYSKTWSETSHKIASVSSLDDHRILTFSEASNPSLVPSAKRALLDQTLSNAISKMQIPAKNLHVFYKWNWTRLWQPNDRPSLFNNIFDFCLWCNHSLGCVNGFFYLIWEQSIFLNKQTPVVQHPYRSAERQSGVPFPIFLPEPDQWCL